MTILIADKDEAACKKIEAAIKKLAPQAQITCICDDNDPRFYASELRFDTRPRVVTFGCFTVYSADGSVINFSRKLSREIFAYLIDQCGYPVTSRDIAADVLETDNFDDNTSKRISKAVSLLISDLGKAGAENVIVKQNRQIRVDKNRISCDLYDALNGDEEARASYHGEYMMEYSWSETSFAMGLLDWE